MAILHREKNRIAVLRFTPTTSEAALAVVPATKSFTKSFFCRSVSLRLLIRIADRIGDGSFLCQPLLKNGTKNGTLSSTIFVFPQTLVPPTGIEPVSPASEADGLSVDLRGQAKKLYHEVRFVALSDFMASYLLIMVYRRMQACLPLLLDPLLPEIYFSLRRSSWQLL